MPSRSVYALCVAATGMLGASVYCYLMRTLKSEASKRFEAQLDDAQLDSYYQIVNERRRAFVVGKVVAFAACLLLIKTTLRERTLCRYCGLIVLINVITVVVYMLYPRSGLRVRDFISAEQEGAWADLKREIWRNLALGFALGVCGFAVFMRVVY